MSKNIRIGDRLVGDERPVFVIAEAGANHNGDLSLAKDMVVAAREAGADCVKFQTFTAEEFLAGQSKQFTYQSQGVEVTESEFDMFKRHEFQRDQWIELMEFCEQQGILFLTTVQDIANLDMMLPLGLKGIKVGSDDFDHLFNLRRYAKTGLPLILAKGMADLSEVEKVLSDVEPRASGGLAVLHCVSLYPAEAHFLNLRQIITLRERFPNVVWGFSDHSRSTAAPALAVMMGARIIEKHFTLDHDMAGPDHWFSMDPDELREMVDHIRFAEQALGDGTVRPSDEEAAIKKIMRRRAVACTDLTAGTVLSEKNVTFKRADSGCYAGEWDNLEGRTLRVDKAPNEPIDSVDVA